MEDAYFAWSGGKDSALALYRVLQQQQYRVKYLLTTVNEVHQRITMHGVRLILLEQQAKAIGIPLKLVWVPENPSMEIYETRMATALAEMQAAGINTAIFGDIFLADLRRYREEKLNQIGMKVVFPLWEENSSNLVQEFIQAGFKAQLICVSDLRLGKEFINRTLDPALIAALPAGVDPAGENGEYHSFVYAGPLFNQPIRFREGEIICRDYGTAVSNPADAPESGSSAATLPPLDARFWFSDLLPVPNNSV